MRISILLLVFFVLFNAWGGLMIQYDVDDHLGISAETGDAEELDQAAAAAKTTQTGKGGIGGTLLGYYNGLTNTLEGVMVGIQPGVQLLVNVVPPGIAEDIIIWAASILPFVIMVDVLGFARSGGL